MTESFCQNALMIKICEFCTFCVLFKVRYLTHKLKFEKVFNDYNSNIVGEHIRHNRYFFLICNINAVISNRICYQKSIKTSEKLQLVIRNHTKTRCDHHNFKCLKKSPRFISDLTIESSFKFPCLHCYD